MEPVRSDLFPRALEGLKVEMMDGETVICDDGIKKMIYLNESATVIFQLCDGQRSIREIIELLKDAYPDASASMMDDVLGVVDYLVQEGALRLERARLEVPATAAPDDAIQG
jgi:coenzyme PQQ biosynthesis protein PqqD